MHPFVSADEQDGGGWSAVWRRGTDWKYHFEQRPPLACQTDVSHTVGCLKQGVKGIDVELQNVMCVCVCVR